MSGITIIEQCSPTLAGIKTANLFTARFSSLEEERKEIRHLNRILRRKGIRAISVGRQKNRTLIYLYRPAYLKKDFSNAFAADILREKGYSPEDPAKCIVQLIRHLASDGEFPHEIGLFLGYPPVDVRGFMNNTREGVQYAGYWKVYGNIELAEKTFQEYRDCTKQFLRLYQNGVSLTQLAVMG